MDPDSDWQSTSSARCAFKKVNVSRVQFFRFIVDVKGGMTRVTQHQITHLQSSQCSI